MESATKTKISDLQMSEMVKRAFGKDVMPEEIRELTDGCFNAAYLLTLSNGVKSVLKISPPKNTRVMRYEKNIMETEVNALNSVSAFKNVPVPKVLYHDTNMDITDSEFFFMEFIDGVPLNKIRAELSDEQLARITAETGTFAKSISGVKSNYFGYISQEDKRFDTWGEAFGNMIRELVEDAE